MADSTVTSHPCSSILGRLAAVVLTVLAAAAVQGPAREAAAAQKFLVPDGSRATPVHRLPLLDEDSVTDKKKPAINPADTLVMPFSPQASCSGICHNYAEVEGGWHTSATDTRVAPGRPGEPWILVDLKTGTQIPISYRKWPRTWQPADLGLTAWKFQIQFGRHAPGFQEAFLAEVRDDKAARFMLSGGLDINCLACHSSDPALDMSEWATNIEKQNLRWATTAASGMATVSGDCRSLPEDYNNIEEDNGDDPKRQPMRVQYDTWRFNSKKPHEVLLPIVANPSNDRCYYCHTNKPIGENAPAKWAMDEDVHIKAGLACTACHRNGNDHKMTRGYEGEPTLGPVSNLTCRGCHLGEESATAGSATAGGRLGAPVPQHKGLPTIHLKNLTCTTCHSGPMPTAEAGRLMTSRAHGLGIKAKEHRDDAPPFIQWPVYVRGDDGRIGPQKVLWPAFWGRAPRGVTKMDPHDLSKINITPIDPAVVAQKAGLKDVPLKTWKPLTADQIVEILKTLNADKDAGEAVYVSGGKVWGLDEGGKLTALNPYMDSFAAPAMWPIAHDVRPAMRALGSGGCTDCHSDDSPISFGTVAALSPADLGPDAGPPVVKTMYEFQGRDPQVLKSWALSYKFRPVFKVVGFITAGFIGAVLLLYGFLGLAAMLKCTCRKAP
jgi:hypothetical protein